MNKAELIRLTAERTGASRKDTEAMLNSVLDIISETLSNGEKVQLVGFGAFEVKERAPRLGRNPHTKDTCTIPATRVAVFHPGKSLKEAVAEKK